MRLTLYVILSRPGHREQVTELKGHNILLKMKINKKSGESILNKPFSDLGGREGMIPFVY